jgi:C-terminal processing protease CtpA/Prc
VPSAPLAFRPDAVYRDEAYPSREQRLLALFRLWNVIHFFYPYLHLMGDTWDRALVEGIPRFEAARDEREYTLAVMELAARIPDGHVSVQGNATAREIAGEAGLPVVVQRIEGLPVVTAIDDAGARAAGIAVGDVIVSVDGQPFGARTARLRPYVAGSNDWARAYYLDLFALRGPSGSTATLGIRRADELPREVHLARAHALKKSERPSAFRVLPEGLGYVDLRVLEVADVDAMFTALEKAPGIVFDMRGYPKGTAWSIAPRLAVRQGATAALFSRPLVGGAFGDGRHEFVQRLDPTTKPRYRGVTVMLVDERTISQAEHTGLFFEAANGTRFVGSPSAGANGDVTVTCLPANLCMWFTGHDVRHADGRQLQRVGLVPDVAVRPTLKGLREGRDEVLERAVAYLQERVRQAAAQR